jgi:MFS family permease
VDSHPHTKRQSLRALEWLNFWVADVQTGIGPFLAAYLASSGWGPQQVGLFLSYGGLFPIALQTPAGGLVDLVRNKKNISASAIVLIAGGALLLAWKSSVAVVASAQAMLSVAGLFLAPVLTAITLGIVGSQRLSFQIGRNQSFSAAGNVATALLMAAVSYWIGMRSVFVCAAVLALPTLLCLSRVRSADIDVEEARGSIPSDASRGAKILPVLMGDRALLVFFLCAALFHLANAAMLPQLGEMLAHGHARVAGAFMSACVTVTQLVIFLGAAPLGKFAANRRRRPLLLSGFSALVVRGLLYTVVHGSAELIAVQVLDGVANLIFGLVSVLVIADRTHGTGRFNLVQGALATCIGIGAASSTAYGGWLVQRFGYNESFLGLAAVATLAWVLLFFLFPETHKEANSLVNSPVAEGTD